MPETQIIFYQEEDGTVPVVEWLKKLKKKNPKGFINCLARIQQLQALGHELREDVSPESNSGA